METEKEKPKVIDSVWTFVAATAVLGPFALPLLWRNPRYDLKTKVLASVIVIGFTLWLMYFANSILGELVYEIIKLSSDSTP